MMKFVPGVWACQNAPGSSTPGGELQERTVSLSCQVRNTCCDADNNHCNEWDKKSGKGQPAVPACRSETEDILHHLFS